MSMNISMHISVKNINMSVSPQHLLQVTFKFGNLVAFTHKECWSPPLFTLIPVAPHHPLTKLHGNLCALNSLSVASSDVSPPPAKIATKIPNQ